METVLHIGCHRSGSTTFQAYLDTHAAALRQKGVVSWGPDRTRKGLFAGLIPRKTGPRSIEAHARAVGRIRMNLAQTQQTGAKALLVSDQNLMGSVQANLRAGSLYPAIGERMAQVAHGFGEHLTRIVLVFRSQDRYWASALSTAVANGAPIPSQTQLKEIATRPRRWRDVITDLACAVPKAEICVIPYEAFCADPETLMGTTCKLPAVRNTQREWHHRALSANGLRRALMQQGADPEAIPSGDTPWTPFSERQIAHMQEHFADDLFWLAAGAEGLAKLTEQAMPGGRGKAHRDGAIRGRENDQKGSLEQTG